MLITILTLLAAIHQAPKKPLKEYVVYGQVINRHNNRPIANANVYLYDTKSIKRAETLTNNNGDFSIIADSDETFHLVIVSGGMEVEERYFHGRKKSINCKKIKLEQFTK